MSDHAPLAPSAAHRWISCPGSVALSAHCEDETSPYAEEGTRAHQLASIALTSGLQASHFVGANVSCPDGDSFAVDVEMAAHVQTYLDVVKLLPRGQGLYIEQEVHLFKDVWGTADAVAIDDEWHVCDFKYGQGVLVDVEDNPQLMIYALAALKTLRRFGKPRHIWLHIVQPRHYQGGHSSQKWSVRELMHWKDSVLIPAVRRVRRGCKRLSAGDWCRFCPVAGSCPEIHRAAVETAQSTFPALREEVRGPIRPEDLTPEQLGKLLEALPTVETWIKQIRANAQARMESGQSVPGYKLVRTSPRRKWKDEDEAMKSLAESFPLAGILALKSPAQVEKLGKAAKKAVSLLVETPEGRLTMAKESDSRKAATSLPCFTPVDQES